jgi:hypothetical protein
VAQEPPRRQARHALPLERGGRRDRPRADAGCRDAGHRPFAVGPGPRILPARDDAGRGRPHRADGVLDAQARAHAEARARAGHAAQCERRELVGSLRRGRARRRAGERRDGGLPVRARRAGRGRPVVPRHRRARRRCRPADVLVAPAGRAVRLLADLLPGERGPAAASGRRAARVGAREAGRAGPAAGSRRSGVGHFRAARRFGSLRRHDRGVHRLSCPSRPAAAPGPRRLLGRARRANASRRSLRPRRGLPPGARGRTTLAAGLRAPPRHACRRAAHRGPGDASHVSGRQPAQSFARSTALFQPAASSAMRAAGIAGSKTRSTRQFAATSAASFQ